MTRPSKDILLTLPDCPKCGEADNDEFRWGGWRKLGMFYLKCTACGYTTAAYRDPEQAVQEWEDASVEAEQKGLDDDSDE